MSNVFISYSEEDRNSAVHLRQLLLSYGVYSFIDIDIKTGDNRTEVIRRAIEHSDALVVLISNHYTQNSGVKFQLGAAWGQEKLLIPLVLPNTDPENVLPILDGLQFIHINSSNDWKEAAAYIGNKLSVI